MTDERKLASDILHIAILALLLGGLLFAALYIGVVKCGVVPGLCDVYFFILRFTEGGTPKVLIVHGNEGLGNGELLERLIEDHDVLGIPVDRQQLSLVSAGNLRDYDLVIVTQAKTISTNKLRIFLDYADYGGRLVWTGDAGTAFERGDTPLYEHEREGKPTCEDILRVDPHADLEGTDCVYEADAKIINPWARVDDENRMINFDKLIGVQYITKFCDIRTCDDDPYIGELAAEPGADHALISGIRPNLAFYGDFAVVQDADGAFAKRILSVEYIGYIPVDIDGDGNSRILPMIVVSGLGERVVYYAAPLENFMTPNSRLQSPTIIENMYYGMIEGT